MMSYFGWLQSLNQSLGAYIHWGGTLPQPPHDAKPGGPSEQASMQAPFPAEAYERMKKLFQKPLRCQEELGVKCVFLAMITSQCGPKMLEYMHVILLICLSICSRASFTKMPRRLRYLLYISSYKNITEYGPRMLKYKQVIPLMFTNSKMLQLLP